MTTPATLPQTTDLPDARLRGAVVRYTQHALREWRAVLTELEEKSRYGAMQDREELAQLADHMRLLIGAFERATTEPAGDRSPEHLGWFDITGELARDEQAGWALWEQVKGKARQELVTGQAAAQFVETPDSTPYDRAQFIALREALVDGLQPRNGLEGLLVDTMAQALTLHRRWLAQHATMAAMDAARVNGDIARRGEWTPPRLAEAETVDRAAMHADRAMRTFLRTLKAYRDGRKLIGNVTVLGGQLNVADTQLIAAAGD